jgi:hypothetical protein
VQVVRFHAFVERFCCCFRRCLNLQKFWDFSSLSFDRFGTSLSVLFTDSKKIAVRSISFSCSSRIVWSSSSLRLLFSLLSRFPFRSLVSLVYLWFPLIVSVCFWFCSFRSFKPGVQGSKSWKSVTMYISYTRSTKSIEISAFAQFFLIRRIIIFLR